MGIFSSKKAKRREIIERNRTLLHNDWRLITAAITTSIKQHWNTLEDKFERHIEEDDYNSQFLDSRFSKEIVYFSHKIVLPELNRLIDEKRIRQNSLAVLPHPQSTLEDLYGIRYEDSATVTADKYISGLLDDGRGDRVNDEFLYSIFGSNIALENSSNNPSDKANLLELSMDGRLQSDKPMRVTFLSGIVFMLFYAMYSSRPSTTLKTHPVSLVDFTGNDPYKYEEYIKGLLRSRGFTAKRTRGSGDFGVDVVASKGGKTFAIQVKLYNRPVGTKAIQEIVSGRIFYKTDFAIVVSDNSFTDAAKILARRSDVLLAHHKNLLHKLENLIPADDDELDEPASKSEERVSTPKKQWTTENADELITVILPTIANDK